MSEALIVCHNPATTTSVFTALKTRGYSTAIAITRIDDLGSSFQDLREEQFRVAVIANRPAGITAEAIATEIWMFWPEAIVIDAPHPEERGNRGFSRAGGLVKPLCMDTLEALLGALTYQDGTP